MRKMDYCRYDSPTNFGELGIGNKNGEFYLDHPLENGIYMVVITDPVDGDTYTMHLTVKGEYYAYANFISAIVDSRSDITFIPNERNIIHVTQGHVSEGSTIELYKLN